MSLNPNPPFSITNPYLLTLCHLIPRQARLSILMPFQSLILLGCSPLPPKAEPAPKDKPPTEVKGEIEMKEEIELNEEIVEKSPLLPPSAHRVHMVEWSTDSSLLENLPASPPPSPPASAELGDGGLGWLAPFLCKAPGAVAAEAGLFVRQPYDPIAKFFAYAPAWWGNVSYGQYVLQMVAYQMWPG